MLSLMTINNTHTHIPNCNHHQLPPLNSHLVHFLSFEYNLKKRARSYKRPAAILSRYLRFTEVRKGWNYKEDIDGSWCCLCVQSEGDAELEEEIMDFMSKSDKPTMFPTKEELVKAGRIDLAEAIKKKGGWYSLGWEEENVVNNESEAMDFDIREFQRRVESCNDGVSLRETNNDGGVPSTANSDNGNWDSLQSADSRSLGESL